MIIVNLLIILVNTQILDTLGYQYKLESNGFSNLEGKKITIKDSCRKIKIQNPTLNSKANKDEYYFLVNLTCNDIVDDEEFFNQERDVGNSTIDANSQPTNISSYQCTLNVTFDNSEHCCCPNRKYGFQSKILN
ncbi:unnamed protein product [Paramecium sonneborni]|uniref:Uncharacterized protein n=1 Tax=Paramecium sonneborni TaxID=65129 RepID=A0A8S1M7F0_9CILI|nr:unnamed protein product [Paramecium sonneborni]